MSFKVLVRFCFHYYREKKAVALYNDMRQAGRSKSKNHIKNCGFIHWIKM